MPAKYHCIHIAGWGPQLEIISVGVRTMMKLKIVMAHLWKGILKRKIIGERVSEEESHTQTLKKPSHLSHNKVKYIQDLFSLPDWHTDWAAWKHFVAVLQDKSPCDGHRTLSLPFPTYHSQSRFLSIAWHRPYQHSDKSTLGATFLPQVWLHHKLGAFNTPALKQQECYRIEKRPTQLAKSGYIQEEFFPRVWFSVRSVSLSHPYSSPQEEELATSSSIYFWRTLPLEDMEGHSTQCNILYYTWQVAVSTANYLRVKQFWKHAHENPRFRGSKISGHV